MKEVLINVFCTDHLSGSPQYFKFFEDDNLRRKEFENFQVTNECDYSFVSTNSNNAAVSWKNKNGEIQFCGSAAYGLAWYLLQEKDNSSMEINNGTTKLFAHNDGDNIRISIPGLIPQFVKKVDNLNIYFQQESGVYFIQMSDILILDSIDIETYCSKYELSEIHGLCVFHWNSESSQGGVRYFTPWHGRNEDYVTGSIQQSLTPLVFEKYGNKNQCWRQLSKNGGQLFSTYENDLVTIQGKCHLTDYNV